MADAGDDRARGGIQVIERAAGILRVLRQSQTGMSLAEIAEATSLPRSTVQRIVGALVTEDFVSIGPRGRSYRLGPEIDALAATARFRTVESCRLLLTELSQATGETADLSVLRTGAMIFLDQVPGIHRLRTVSAVGDAFPLTDTANGRACLAELPDADALAMARSEWDRHGIEGDEARFLEMLAEIRRTGLAYDIDEHTEGIAAIGVAFRDWQGSLHAISVPVPTSRLESTKDTIEAALKLTRTHLNGLFSRTDVP